MSIKVKRDLRQRSAEAVTHGLANEKSIKAKAADFQTDVRKNWKIKLLSPAVSILLLAMVTLGFMNQKGWLPSTDPLTGKKTGWFGAELPKNAANSWNPFAAPSPTPTPQLSKEYIYAGSRLLAVEDANATAAPPADLAVWRPSTGYWYVLGGPGSQPTGMQLGAPDDKTVPGDFDGDGKTDFSVFRPGNGIWYIVRSSDTTLYGVQFGSSGDITAPADYDGDGKTDAAVYRPSTGYWYIQGSTVGFYSAQFGAATDTPSPADYDGDGKADIAVWRPGNQTFYIVKSSDNTTTSGQIGTSSSDKPVSADYDGDGRADMAVKSGTNWIILKSSTNQTETISWQQAGDEPVQNDYDGDGKVDIAVWNDADGYWRIRQSSLVGQSGELRSAQWGAPGDKPVPAFYHR